MAARVLVVAASHTVSSAAFLGATQCAAARHRLSSLLYLLPSGWSRISPPVQARFRLAACARILQ